MAKKNLWLGILVMVLVVGMAVVGCDGDDDSTSGSGGTFTLTNIPLEHNNYAVLGTFGGSDLPLAGAQSVNMATTTFKLSRILNGSVNIPLWISTGSSDMERYTGNGTCNIWVKICNSETMTISEIGDVDNVIAEIRFESVTFSNGNATKSWGDGVIHN
jgi:hypothetical protein